MYDTAGLLNGVLVNYKYTPDSWVAGFARSTADETAVACGWDSGGWFESMNYNGGIGELCGNTWCSCPKLTPSVHHPPHPPSPPS